MIEPMFFVHQILNMNWLQRSKTTKLCSAYKKKKYKFLKSTGSIFKVTSIKQLIKIFLNFTWYGVSRTQIIMVIK